MKKQLIQDERLQRLVEQVSLDDFGRPFRHKAYFNPRLRTTGGRYMMSTHHLEFNPKQLEVHGEEEFVKIVRHELCHYHLHLEGKGYRHQDQDFKQLLKQVGGSRYCKSLPDTRSVRTAKYVYICMDCHMSYVRKKRMDVRRYRCGKCRGRLQMAMLNK